MTEAEMKADLDRRGPDGRRAEPNRAGRRRAMKAAPRAFRLYDQRSKRKRLGLSPR